MAPPKAAYWRHTICRHARFYITSPRPRSAVREWCTIRVLRSFVTPAGFSLVKTCEPAGDAWIARQHTDTSRGAAHRHLERTLAPSQYTIPAHRPGAPRLRLLTFAVSVRGALGSEAQTFIRQLSARMAGAVPYRLLDEASWATQGCAPLLRSAIAFSARRALAAGIRRSTCSAAEATYVQRCDDQPAADPACCFDCPVDPAPAEQ